MKKRFTACVLTIILAFSFYGASVFATPVKSLNANWVYNNNGKLLNIRKIAKMPATSYNVMQGSCTDGANYFYFSFMNKSNDLIKVAKIQYVDGQYVFVSSTDVLDCHHGNDMAYIHNVGGISGNDKILIANAEDGNRYTLKVLDVATMTLENNLSYQWWKKANLTNCELIYADGTELEDQETINEIDKVHGYSNIAYDEANKRLVSCTCSVHDLVVLGLSDVSGNLNITAPTKYIVYDRNESILQGIDCDSDYIYILWSPESGITKYNRLCVYDWNGVNVKNYNIDKSYEIESIYHTGSGANANFFATYHHSYRYTYTTKEKVKVKVKKVWNEDHTKKIWKYKTKTVKVSHSEIRRNAYIKNLGYINSGF